MAKPGDLVYRVWNGELETYKVIEESIVEGATQPTWLMRQLGDEQKFRSSPAHYFTTVLAAYQAYRKECEDALEPARKAIRDATDHLAYVFIELAKTERIIKGIENGKATP